MDRINKASQAAPLPVSEESFDLVMQNMPRSPSPKASSPDTVANDLSLQFNKVSTANYHPEFADLPASPPPRVPSPPQTDEALLTLPPSTKRTLEAAEEYIAATAAQANDTVLALRLVKPLPKRRQAIIPLTPEHKEYLELMDRLAMPPPALPFPKRTKTTTDLDIPQVNSFVRPKSPDQNNPAR